MTVKPLPVYFHAIIKEPGVSGAPHEFLSVFNPANSGKAVVALGFIAQSYSINSATATEPLQVFRTTAASVGSQIAAASVNRFDPRHPDPKAEVRVSGPTVTKTGLSMLGIAPVISVGTGSNGQTVAPTPGASFIILPGTGITFGTTDGDVDQIWNLQFIWGEAS
jgi:hypothetical protein